MIKRTTQNDTARAASHTQTTSPCTSLPRSNCCKKKSNEVINRPTTKTKTKNKKHNSQTIQSSPLASSSTGNTSRAYSSMSRQPCHRCRASSVTRSEMTPPGPCIMPAPAPFPPAGPRPFGEPAAGRENSGCGKYGASHRPNSSSSASSCSRYPGGMLTLISILGTRTYWHGRSRARENAAHTCNGERVSKVSAILGGGLAFVP